MSSLTLQLLSFGLLCAGVGLWLWQRARWQDKREASGAGIDQLMALDSDEAIHHAMVQAQMQQRRRAIGDTRRWPINHIFLRAGLAPKAGTVTIAAALPAAMGAVGAIFAGPLFAVGMVVLGCVLIFAWIRLRIGRQRRALTHDIPTYLDNVVRMMTVGHSVQSAFQNAPAAGGTPLGRAVEHSSRLQAGGLEPDQALLAVGELYDSTELMLLASILRMATRFGGRADLIISRVAVFIRDREQAQQELMAQSSETRLSAWVLGLLPVSLACYIIAANPVYIGRMWGDPTGKNMLIGAIFLQLAGAAMLYKLTKSLED